MLFFFGIFFSSWPLKFAELYIYLLAIQLFITFKIKHYIYFFQSAFEKMYTINFYRNNLIFSQSLWRLLHFKYLEWSNVRWVFVLLSFGRLLVFNIKSKGCQWLNSQHPSPPKKNHLGGIPPPYAVLFCCKLRIFLDFHTWPLIEKSGRQDFMHMIARPSNNKDFKNRKQCEAHSIYAETGFFSRDMLW